jgi:TrmH family RNA methyltransferase
MGAHFSVHCFENFQLKTFFPISNSCVCNEFTSFNQLYTKRFKQACVWILGNEQGASDYALEHAQLLLFLNQVGKNL